MKNENIMSKAKENGNHFTKGVDGSLLGSDGSKNEITAIRKARLVLKLCSNVKNANDIEYIEKNIPEIKENIEIIKESAQSSKSEATQDALAKSLDSLKNVYETLAKLYAEEIKEFCRLLVAEKKVPLDVVNHTETLINQCTKALENIKTQIGTSDSKFVDDQMAEIEEFKGKIGFDRNLKNKISWGEIHYFLDNNDNILKTQDQLNKRSEPDTDDR